MDNVTQFPGKAKQDSTLSKEVVLSLSTYEDYRIAWTLLKQLSLTITPQACEGLTPYQRELLTIADQLPFTPGHREEEK